VIHNKLREERYSWIRKKGAGKMLKSKKNNSKKNVKLIVFLLRKG
jgi:hypothetical protein